MVKRNHHGKLINFILGMVSGICEPVRTTMGQWLGDSKEEETNGHTSTVQHEEIGCVVEFGFFIFLAEFDVTVANSEPKDKEGKGRIGNNVEPSELSRKKATEKQ